MKLELTIDPNYVPNWTASDGIREFIQNARDSEVQYGAKMTVDWQNNKLRIENAGVILTRETLLLGNSSKRGNSELIGSHGEGGKTGVLALLRAGMTVKIRNGSELWEPKIERSDRFNSDVLVFHIRENNKFENRVRVEISPIDEEMWNGLRGKFLFLDSNNVGKIKTSTGTLLIDPKYVGMIFVKGIFVQNTKNSFGYDFSRASLDRDRRMVDSWDTKYNIRKIWDEALASRPELFEIYSTLIDNQSEDISGIDSYSVQSMPKDALAYITEKFSKRYGADAVPVETVEESKDIEYYGKKGIVCTKQLGALLNVTIGDFKKVRESLRNETKHSYSWHELSTEERDCFESTVSILETALGKKELMKLVDIVDFASSDLEGLFRDGRIQIRHSFLKQPAKFLQVMIHELAHQITYDDDGGKNHVSTIEDIWMKVYSYKK